MTDNQLELFGSDESPAERGEETEDDRPAEADIDLGRFDHPPALAVHLFDNGISRGQIRLAAELADMEPYVDEQGRRALFMAVLIGLEAHGQGSTFVPLPGRAEYFQRRMTALIPRHLAETNDRWDPSQLVATLGEIIDDDLHIVGNPGDFKPLIVDHERLYHQRVLLYETRLVDAVATRLQRPGIEYSQAELKRAFDQVRTHQPVGNNGDPIRLNPEQQYALLTALHRPMTLITGGPGTGKTSIVVSILRTLVRLDTSPGSIALAAPTGKAANRMAESIYEQLGRIEELTERDHRLAEQLEDPRTLHRLLGYSPHRDTFHHHEQNPLAHRMVIVDESSMIDLFLMERLLAAVSPTAQLVLLGDADQLPSVDTGAVLRDLIPEVTSTDAPWRNLVDGSLSERRGDSPTSATAVRLKRSYRMRPEDPAGRQILTFARAIRDYEDDSSLALPDTFTPPDDGGDGLAEFPDGVHRWAGAETDHTETMDDFVDWWFDRIVLDGDRPTWRRRFNHTHCIGPDGELTEAARDSVRQLIRHYRRARLLTLTRVFATGSERLNERLHRATARLGEGRLDYRHDFHPGEPVMMTRNDYDRDLFNGDQGVVVWCRHTDDTGEHDISLMAVFERTHELVVYPVTELSDDLEHAFAMTVHKAQGSEFDRVAMVLPTEPMTLLNRELLYTGLTRAKRGVLLVGRGQLLEVGAATRSERFSAIDEKLVERTTEV